MAVLLVTYDLNSPGQAYTNLLGYIKTFSWAKLSESSYAIRTNESPTVVRDRIRQITDTNDNVYVITLRQPYSGWGPKEVNDWLDNNLT